jgi:hypothetical protein
MRGIALVLMQWAMEWKMGAVQATAVIACCYITPGLVSSELCY